MTEDFYDLLDIPSDASQDEIKQAFRTQVRQYHPDLNDDERAQAQFTALKKAYDILGDPVERTAYDRLGHETYVAKRTSGLPSPDAWKGTSSRDSSQSSETESSSSGSGSAKHSRSRTRTNTASSNSQRRRSSRTRTAGGGSSTAGAASGGGSSSGTGPTQSATASPRSDSGLRHRVGRWWRNQNFAWPLIWTATLCYIAGLLQYGVTHASQLDSLRADLSAVGADPNGLWQTVTTSRHGLESVATFAMTATPVSPQVPLEQWQWYGALAGLVGGALLVIVGTRVAWRAETWGRLSTDELMLLAGAIAISTTLIGGPLLAGTVLMPLLFGVIIHRTRQLPGWAPSPLYAIAVCLPAIGLGVGISGATLSIPLEFVLFVLVPLAGSVGLLCRVQVRKRFKR